MEDEKNELRNALLITQADNVECKEYKPQEIDQNRKCRCHYKIRKYVKKKFCPLEKEKR